MRNVWVNKKLAVAIALSVLVSFALLPYGLSTPGNPVLDYLQTVVKPLLDTINATVNSISATVGSIKSDTTSIKSEVVDIERKLDNSARVLTFKATLITQASSSLILEVDEAAGLDVTKIKRYTVAIGSNRPNIPPNTGSISVAVRVLGVQIGPVGAEVLQRSLPSHPAGIFVGPFVGTRLQIATLRGADGLGTLEFNVNVYVEALP